MSSPWHKSDPAFYTDVTDAYRLGRGGRLRTDLGGVYFNAIVVCAMAAVFWVTDYEPLLLVCFILQVQIVQQMLPLLRLDGYYVLSDAVGVPDLFRRIGPILRSAIPFRKAEPEVQELKGRVRAAVTAWVLILVPLLLANFLYILLSAPRIAATAWDSASQLWGEMTSSSGATMVMAAIQLLFLLIPAVGITYTFTRLGTRSAKGAWGWSSGSPARRMGVVVGAVLVVVGLALAWWPDARWSPYRPGEPGTLQQGVYDVASVGQGDPLLRLPSEAQQPLPPVDPGTSAITGTGSRPGVPDSDPGIDPEAPGGDPTGQAPDDDVAPSDDPTSSPTDDQSSEPTDEPTDEPTATETTPTESTPTESTPTTSPTTSAATP